MKEAAIAVVFTVGFFGLVVVGPIELGHVVNETSARLRDKGRFVRYPDSMLKLWLLGCGSLMALALAIMVGYGMLHGMSIVIQGVLQ